MREIKQMLLLSHFLYVGTGGTLVGKKKNTGFGW